MTRKTFFSLVVLALASAFPADATIALVQVKSAFNTSASTTQAVTFTSTPTVGNTIVVGVSASTSAQLIGTDNKGNFYSLAIQHNNGSVAAAILCAAVFTSSATFTVTITTASAFISVFAAEYSGLSCAVDNGGFATTGSSPYACGTYTTFNANDLLVSVIDINGGTTLTYTAGTGYTVQMSQTSSTGQPGAYEDQIVSATGAQAPTISSNTNATSSCASAAFYLPASATGGGSFGFVQ